MNIASNIKKNSNIKKKNNIYMIFFNEYKTCY